MPVGHYRRAFRAFNESTPLGAKLLLYFLLIFAAIATIGVAFSAYDDYKFDRLSPPEHLSIAKTLLNDPLVAARHLGAIPATAPEHEEADKLLAVIQNQQQQRAAQAEQASRAHEQISREQMLRNRQGAAHDPYICNISTRHEPIMSFDDGRYWWTDDGRCALKLQDQRNRDAEWQSYWATTIRVDTDINSSWLPDEERTCQTYPDVKGRVSVIACSSTGSRDHNIPVKFWGGVDRNTVSDWRCRRESDNFVCRAIN